MRHGVPGTSEPAGPPGSRWQPTEPAYDRAPRPTWTAAIGTPDRPGVATPRMIRTPEGVEGDVTLALGYGPGEEPALDVLPELAGELVTRHGPRTTLRQLRAARRDLNAPPRFAHPPLPYAFVLGPRRSGRPDATPRAGRHSTKPPVQLGPNAWPGYCYPLGDGETAESRTALEQLMRHLRGAPPAWPNASRRRSAPVCSSAIFRE